MSIIVRAEAWVSPPVTVATCFRDRWRGLRPHSQGRALLLKGYSVHGIGMREALWAIGLDQVSTVVEVCLLLPYRVVRIPQATWLLEMAAIETPPPIGSKLTPVRGPESGPRLMAGSG